MSTRRFVASVLLLLAMTVPSLADREGYCDPYAHDIADRKAGDARAAAQAFEGTIGATTGLAWRNAYVSGYYSCMQFYAEDASVSFDDETQPSPLQGESLLAPEDAPALATEPPKSGTPA